ncbi:MAG: hypothetical protein CSA22_02095 [Deltaproteobacteria bacterium]|nr:MAG: hypothetical protein CSA22_02095 [Deltaproteobacteria bacterium]
MLAMNKRYRCLCVILLWSVLRVSPASTQPLAAPEIDPEKPLQFQADRLEAFTRDNRIVLTGTVVAWQDNWKLFSDTMAIDYVRNTEKTQTSTDTGNGSKETTDKTAGRDTLGQAARNVRQVTAEGHVVIHFQTSVARTDTAVFDRSSGLLILQGEKTTLTTPESSISGQRITLNQHTGTVAVEGSADAPVEAFFQPETDPASAAETKQGQ